MTLAKFTSEKFLLYVLVFIVINKYIRLHNYCTRYTVCSVGDPWHFGADPDPRICISDLWIRIREPKNMGILRIRIQIPNTDYMFSCLYNVQYNTGTFQELTSMWHTLQ